MNMTTEYRNDPERCPDCNRTGHVRTCDDCAGAAARTTPTVTDSQIRTLSTEAAEHGDLEQVALCDAALAGNKEARRKCVAAIADALAMAETPEGAAGMTAVASINSAGIRALAAAAGLTHIAMVGEGGGEGDTLVRFWAMGETYVAETNGDPVERESDPEAFDALAEECGVDLD